MIAPMAQLTTVKMSPVALRLLRLVAAITGEKQYEVLDRVLGDEFERVRDNV